MEIDISGDQPAAARAGFSIVVAVNTQISMILEYLHMKKVAKNEK
jgi:hypothetical protein